MEDAPESNPQETYLRLIDLQSIFAAQEYYLHLLELQSVESHAGGYNLAVEQPIGRETRTIVAHANLQEKQGSMSRSFCRATGRVACEQICARADDTAKRTLRQCAEQNVQAALQACGLDRSHALELVSPREGSSKGYPYAVGFADELPVYESKGFISTNKAGLKELAGYNACFARKEEVSALVCRGNMSTMQVAFELQGLDRQTVIGLFSMPMLRFERKRIFQRETQEDAARRQEKFRSPISLALKLACEHYGIDPKQVYVHLLSGVGAIQRSFGSWSDMRKRFPGWYEQGLIGRQSGSGRNPGEQALAHYTGTWPGCDGWFVRMQTAMMTDIVRALQDLEIPPTYVSRPMSSLLTRAKQGFSVGDPELRLTAQDLYVVSSR